MINAISNFYNIGKNELFKLCRSITGKDTLKTLKIIKKYFPELKIYQVKSGKKVFDWKIPAEWNIEDAYVLDNNNNKIIDFKKNNLHIINYSSPINFFIKKNKLLKKLYSNPKLPEAIPYITSYYKKNWGFCVSDKLKKKIRKNYNAKDNFKVFIKSKFNKKGHLNYGEYLLKGKSKDEILISTYICHPSMANNELSGIIVSMSLINHFKKFKKLNKTIRFLFIPETIGSITYLNKNLQHLKKNVIGGYNLSCIGDDRLHSCMLTKYKNTISDKALLEAYKKIKIKPKIFSFLKRGSDERQYNSPGIDLNIASIFRTKYGEYPEYHTSLDNFNLVTKKGISGGFKVAKTAVKILQNKIIPKSNILCEPFLTKKKLYPVMSNLSKSNKLKKHIGKDVLDFLMFSDGTNDLFQISKFIKRKYSHTKKIYKILKETKLIQ